MPIFKIHRDCEPDVNDLQSDPPPNLVVCGVGSAHKPHWELMFDELTPLTNEAMHASLMLYKLQATQERQRKKKLSVYIRVPT